MRKLYTDEKIAEIYEGIAKLFREERKRQNLSVADIEKMTGIDRTAIYKMERGIRRFGFENLIKMCYCLGFELNDLHKVPIRKKRR